MPTAEYYKKNREKVLKQLREKYKADPEYYKSRSKNYRLNNPDKYRNSQLKTKFGISLKEYNKLLTKQNGRCIICEELENGKDLAVDHCHSTGKIRGLLCSNCNIGLGQFKDKIDLLEKAIIYLRRHNEKSSS